MSHHDHDARTDAIDIDPDSAEISVLDPGPISYHDLPCAGDDDLERQIDARWGCYPATLRWRLIELPIQALAMYSPKLGLDYYRKLAEADAAILAEHEVTLDEAEIEVLEESGFADGERRLRLVERYCTRYASGEEVEPLVIAWEETLQLLDGFHRLAAAFEAGVERIRAYALLEEE